MPRNPGMYCCSVGGQNGHREAKASVTHQSGKNGEAERSLVFQPPQSRVAMCFKEKVKGRILVCTHPLRHIFRKTHRKLLERLRGRTCAAYSSSVGCLSGQV
jgi:hypothetical protein